MPSKKTVEKWIDEIEVRDINWSHITKGHLPGAPPDKSIFSVGGEELIRKLCTTIKTKQNRVLADAGNSSRALVIRDFAPDGVGMDRGRTCTYCVVLVGEDKRRIGKGSAITAFPATQNWVNRQSGLS